MIRLEGAERDVVAIASVAARTLRRDSAVWQTLATQLPGLRGQAFRLMRDHPPVSSVRRAATVLWWVALSFGLSAALAPAVMLSPPGGKNSYADPEVSITIAVWSAVVGALLLGAVLVVRVPRGESPKQAVVLTVVLATVVALLVSYRLVVGTGDDRGFTPDQLGRATPLAVLDLLLLVLLVVRLERVRRRTPDPARSNAPFRRQWLRRDAETLAALPAAPEVDDEWQRQLYRQVPQAVDARTVGLARTMTPVAWLVWAFVDTDLDVSGVLRPE